MLSLLATSFQEPGKVTFYNLVLFVHISAAIIAFGVVFTYPVTVPLAQRAFPRHLPAVHRMQRAVGQRIITPAAILILLAGIYLAAKGPYDFGEGFVSAGIALVIIILGLAHAFFIPTEGRAAELAERDLARSGEGEPQLSDEYEQLGRRLAVVGGLTNLLILAAVFLMVVKPGV
jgi:uncharacterized membrane protein